MWKVEKFVDGVWVFDSEWPTMNEAITRKTTVDSNGGKARVRKPSI